MFTGDRFSFLNSFLAPEVIRGERYTFSPDWFGLGCIVYEMIMGQPPFRKRRERLKREEIDRRVCEDAEVYNQRFGEIVRDFTSSVSLQISFLFFGFSQIILTHLRCILDGNGVKKLNLIFPAH